VLVTLATAAAATAATAMTLLIAVVMTVIVTVATTAATTVLMAVIVVMVMVVTMIVTMIVTATTGTVNMAVSQLFGSGGTDVLDLDLEAQGHTSQRMVAIYLDERFGHFDNGHRAVTIVSLGHKSIPFRHFHAVKQLARYFLHQGFVVFAIGLARCQSKVERLAHATAFQLGFEAGDQITGTVQIHQRLFTDSGVDDGQAYGRAPSVMMKKSSLRNGMSLTYAPFLVLLMTSLGTKHPYDLFGLTG